MMNNTVYENNGMNMPYGNFGYPQGQAVPQQQVGPGVSNWLSPEDIALLQKGNGQFSLSVSKTDLARGQCNHYNKNKTSALVSNNDGTVTCSICGTTFRVIGPNDGNTDDVKKAVDTVLDYMNTCKIAYYSLSPDTALTFFQIIPFLEKVPTLYDMAMKDFSKYAGVNTNMNQQNGMNAFGMYAALVNNPMNGFGAPGFNYGAPMAQPYAQPMGYQQPMYNNGMPMNGMPQQPGYNPMYQQPNAPQAAPVQNGYQPAQNGYAFNPMGPAQPVNSNMPVQPNAPQAPVQTGSVNPQPAAQPASDQPAVAVPQDFKK